MVHNSWNQREFTEKNEDFRLTQSIWFDKYSFQIYFFSYTLLSCSLYITEMNAHRIPGQFILMSVVIPALCALINKDHNMSQDNFVGCYTMDGWLLYIKKGCWDNSPSHFAPFCFSYLFPHFSIYQFCFFSFFLLNCSFSHFTSFLFSIAFPFSLQHGSKSIIALSKYGHLWCSARVKYTR